VFPDYDESGPLAFFAGAVEATHHRPEAGLMLAISDSSRDHQRS
jgi:hypothetical protein